MRIVSLDFLRFLAAFAVAGPHLVIYFSIFQDVVILETVTSLAVEIFFVLSGFVLCPFLLRTFRSTSNVGKNLYVFLVRRWMRTLPLYFLSLAAFIILFSGGLDLTGLKYMVFLQNFFWAPPAFDYFSVSWSLAVEEWFYVLFPAFVAVFFLLGGKLGGMENRHRTFFAAAIAFVTVFTLLRIFSHVPVESWGDGLRRVVLFRIDSIGFGIILYLLKDHLYRIPVWVIFLTVLISAAYLFSAYQRILLGHASAIEFRVLVFAATTLFSCAVLAFFLRLDGRFQGWLKRPSLWGGRVSYGVYLFHIPIGALIARFSDFSAGFFLATSILVLCGVTTLVYHFFEKPILDARPHFSFEKEDKPGPS